LIYLLPDEPRVARAAWPLNAGPLIMSAWADYRRRSAALPSSMHCRIHEQRPIHPGTPQHGGNKAHSPVINRAGGFGIINPGIPGAHGFGGDKNVSGIDLSPRIPGS